MADELATLAELEARLDWTLDTGEQGVATAALADLSDDARYYGSDNWNDQTAPRQAKSLVLRAAVRYMRNPDGFTTSRAGDETVQWAESEDLGSASFTKKEQEILASLAGRNTTLWSAPVTAWSPRKSGPRLLNPTTPGLCYDAGHSPVSQAGFAGTPSSFPMYADDEESL